MFTPSRFRKAALTSLALCLGLLWGTAAPVHAQQMMTANAADQIKVDKAKQLEIIDSVCIDLNKIYVFPDVAKKMEKHVRDRYKKGAYKDFTTVLEFTRALTDDFREISHDRHLGVTLMPPNEVEDFHNASQSDDELAQQRERRLAEMARNNYGWHELKLLQGNIGYVKLDGFSDATFGGPTAVAAMNFLANADAVIFDLRQNGGGSPSMIQLIISYLLEEPTHINSFYVRQTDSIEQFWTSAYVSGPKMTDVDVYVLTSHYTFSAAEEFSYNIKNLKRGMIIGEVTGGGAHPVDEFVYPNLNVKMRIPYGRAVNPISGTNWEGTGVTPDIEVPAADALDRAQLEALRKIRERTTDERRLAGLNWAIEGLEAAGTQVMIDPALMQKYAGQYQDRKIFIEDGTLTYQRGENPQMKMLAMSPTLFRFDEIDYFRLEVVSDDSGKPVKLVGHYDDGHTDESPLSN